MTHLYWAWNKRWLFEGVTVGYTLCGKRLPRKDLTVFPEDATCKTCLKEAEGVPMCKRPPTRHFDRSTVRR